MQHSAADPGAALYNGQWPAWRTAPRYQPTAFVAWLELRCAQRQLARGDLARLLAAELPYKRGRRAIYNAVTAWVHEGKLPSYDYVRALSVVLDVPQEQIVDLIPPSRAQRSAAASLPPPPVARRHAAPPRATSDQVRAQAVDEFLASVRQTLLKRENDELEALLVPIMHRIRAEAEQLAGRVVPAESVKAATEQPEPAERQEATR